MVQRTTISILVLVFGLLFSLLYVGATYKLFKPAVSEIPNKPAISQQEAFDTVKRYLKANASNFEGIQFQINGSPEPDVFKEEFISDAEFLEQNRDLKLVYYHPNLTVYEMEADLQTGEYTIDFVCDANNNIYCFHPLDDRKRAPLMGKLVYSVGAMQFLYSTRDKGEYTYRWEWFLVDATNGKVLYTTFDCNEKRPQWCK
jgi:hypothetical protein